MEYEFISFDYNDSIERGKGLVTDEQIEKGLQEILDKCVFIVNNWGRMYSREHVVKIGYSHRGHTLELRNGTFEWYYRIEGGYAEEKQKV